MEQPPMPLSDKILTGVKIIILVVAWGGIGLILLQYALAHSTDFHKAIRNMLGGACVWGAIAGALHAKKHRWFFAILGMVAVYGVGRIIFDYNALHYPPEAENKISTVVKMQKSEFS